MRATVRGVVAYLAVMTVWIYAILDRTTADWTHWLVLVVALAQVLVGFAVRRWWVVLLPLILVPISVPAGYPPITPDNAEPFPIAFSIGFWMLFAVPLVVAGLAARVGYDRYAGNSWSVEQ